MKEYRLETETLVDAPIDEVFAFFSDAQNLERLTPASLRFQILTPLPIEMREGALIEYRLRIRGVPVYWQTEIACWEPGKRFVDRQLKGPYRKWVHEHRFEPAGDQTRMFDRVDYALPGGPLAPIAHALFVRKEVERIFQFRTEAIAQAFGVSRAA